MVWLRKERKRRERRWWRQRRGKGLGFWNGERGERPVIFIEGKCGWRGGTVVEEGGDDAGAWDDSDVRLSVRGRRQ